jgi:hypothetical protein
MKRGRRFAALSPSRRTVAFVLRWRTQTPETGPPRSSAADGGQLASARRLVSASGEKLISTVGPRASCLGPPRPARIPRARRSHRRRTGPAKRGFQRRGSAAGHIDPGSSGLSEPAWTEDLTEYALRRDGEVLSSTEAELGAHKTRATKCAHPQADRLPWGTSAFDWEEVRRKQHPE